MLMLLVYDMVYFLSFFAIRILTLGYRPVLSINRPVRRNEESKEDIDLSGGVFTYLF